MHRSCFSAPLYSVWKHSISTVRGVQINDARWDEEERESCRWHSSDALSETDDGRITLGRPGPLDIRWSAASTRYCRAFEFVVNQHLRSIFGINTLIGNCSWFGGTKLNQWTLFPSVEYCAAKHYDLRITLFQRDAASPTGAREPFSCAVEGNTAVVSGRTCCGAECRQGVRGVTRHTGIGRGEEGTPTLRDGCGFVVRIDETERPTTIWPCLSYGYIILDVFGWTQCEQNTYQRKKVENNAIGNV